MGLNLTLSTHLLVYHEQEEALLERVAQAGFDAVEVWLAEPHTPWRCSAGLAEYRQRLADRGLRAGSVHLPFYPSVSELREQNRRWSVIDPAAADRRTAIDGAAEGLRAAAALGASAGVLHLGWQRDDWSGDQAAFAREAVAELVPVANDCGVQLLLENIISEGTRCARLVELLDEVDPAGTAGICLDLGHAHVEGDVVRHLEDALPRLRHLHVHDNDGESDTHHAPGCGSIPWEPVLTRLQAAGFDGQAALELRDFSKGSEAPLAVLDRDLATVADFQQHWAARGLLPAPRAHA